MLKNNRYIGGGKLFFTSAVTGSTEVEIGEVQEATLTFSTTTADAFSKDSTRKTKVAKVVTEITATLKFTTQITNAHNTAMAMLGSEATVDFASGDTLPDGTTAGADVTIPVIKGGTTPIVEGSLKFVGDSDGDTKPVLIVYSAVISPTGDIGYIMEDFSKLSFEGEVLETTDGFADEYRMVVA